MTTFIIPTNETTDPFDQQVEMDGAVFGLAFRWNKRDLHWSMDISRNGGVLVAGIKLVIIPDLLIQYRRTAGLPEGTLFIDDLDGQDNDPDDVNFGDRVVLKYTDVS